MDFLLQSSPVPYLPLYLCNAPDDVFAIVDADLYPILVRRRWYLHKARKVTYVRSYSSNGWGEPEYLHHAVKRLRRRRRPTPNHVVRHLSGNTLDNRGRRLRWGTRRANHYCAPDQTNI